MMSGEVKGRLIEVMTEYNNAFRIKRDAITDEDVKAFMEIRELEF